LSQNNNFYILIFKISGLYYIMDPEDYNRKIKNRHVLNVQKGTDYEPDK